jgi:hypothetical protein
MSKPKVLLSIPNGTGWLHKHCHYASIKLLTDSRVETTHICPTHSPYVHNLHKIQEDFLKDGYDFWVHFDDDNPPQRNIFDLIFLDKDIIGCPTPVWYNKVPGDRPYYFNALVHDKEVNGYRPADSYPGFRLEGLQRVHAVGSGCMVIARRVLADIEAPFMRKWDHKGLVEQGGDYSFCERAIERGFEVYAHFDYRCLHFNEVELNEIIEAFTRMYEK